MGTARKFIGPALLIVAGLVAFLAGTWGRDIVHDQLAPQNITFAPYDATGQKGDDYKAYPELREYAGQKVTDGLQAKAFARYIHTHVMEATGGKSYAEVSAEARANPDDQKLAAIRRTALDG